MTNLLASLKKNFPNITFEEARNSSWAPEANKIYYKPLSKNRDWSLLHEMGHMLSNHQTYRFDIELLQMELEAWQKANELAAKYNILIDKDHIEDCLDSYRDWPYKRSSCPNCSQTGLENEIGKYSCINCGQIWRVTPERFCRVYRKTTSNTLKKAT